MNYTPTREAEPQLVGELLPMVLRELAANTEEEAAAIRLGLLAARYEPSEDEALAA
jgi:hypothetical protein